MIYADVLSAITYACYVSADDTRVAADTPFTCHDLHCHFSPFIFAVTLIVYVILPRLRHDTMLACRWLFMMLTPQILKVTRRRHVSPLRR